MKYSEWFKSYSSTLMDKEDIPKNVTVVENILQKFKQADKELEQLDSLYRGGTIQYVSPKEQSSMSEMRESLNCFMETRNETIQDLEFELKTAKLIMFLMFFVICLLIYGVLQ